MPSERRGSQDIPAKLPRAAGENHQAQDAQAERVVPEAYSVRVLQAREAPHRRAGVRAVRDLVVRFLYTLGGSYRCDPWSVSEDR